MLPLEEGPLLVVLVLLVGGDGTFQEPPPNGEEKIV